MEIKARETCAADRPENGEAAQQLGNDPRAENAVVAAPASLQQEPHRPVEGKHQAAEAYNAIVCPGICCSHATLW